MSFFNFLDPGARTLPFCSDMRVRCPLGPVVPDPHPLPVQFERVGPVTVGRLLLHILRQVDDHDGVERAFLGPAGMGRRDGGERGEASRASLGGCGRTKPARLSAPQLR